MDGVGLPVSLRSILLLAPFALASCAFSTEQSPVGLEEAIILPTPAVRAWDVRSGPRKVGSVVRYEEAVGPNRHVFSVRNLHDQDLGLIEASGRAWRLRPHAEPELLGTGTVVEGVARILGEARVTLREIPL